jgi:hypothetical protein
MTNRIYPAECNADYKPISNKKQGILTREEDWNEDRDNNEGV